ncbi:xanthine dehydrogenase family protein molybdopterin-binding subunit [Gordonia paraffinivorans]|uniref:xanthine dehydrogenase family protein molybdopterin-binding subunit n=1 Tax=Gordonia paraffinivorans TaxID=175628 RepID=UPI0014481FEB|nr:xanthine dehydrogenase family protein molybdopterin-binding subunit [Gordonia paraffinivorans]
MSANTDQQTNSLIGAPVTRVQDDRMLRGDGWYVDDIKATDALHAAVLRSPIAAGRITGFDASDAAAEPSVRLVLGPDELEAGLDTLPAPWLIPGQQEVDFVLFDRQIRYVGQPLAIVVAESRAAAEDALELIELDFEETDAVVSIEEARAEGAPLVHPELGSNQVGQIHFGDPVDALEQAFADAHTVIDRVFSIPRISHNSMEPRGIIAEWVPATGQMTIHSSTQVPHMVRQDVAKALRLRADQVRVVAPDVGGAFGLKTLLFPDEAFVCLAAKTLGAKVKWIEDRSEALVASYQGRGQLDRARLALDADGKFLALHIDLHGDVGAYSCTATGGTGPFQVSGLMAEGPYKYAAAAGATVTAWYTNAVPTGAYRGYGMQEATYVRERLVDEAARVMGIDPVELRRCNMITESELPFVTRLQMPYDSGDYPESLERAVALAEGKNTTSTDRVRRGIGYSSFTEITGFAPTALTEIYGIHWSTWDSSKIRINEDGSVTVFSGLTSIGQGVETAFAQLAAEVLGVPLEKVSVQLGDTAVSPFANMASQASRALTIGGPALVDAATRLRERMQVLAANTLKTEPDNVVFDGEVFSTKDGSASATWQQVAHRGWMGWGRGDSDKIALEELGEYDPPSITYGYATHAAQVAVDLDTGKVDVEAYWLVHDAGVLVNPLIVEGQIAGGVAMGFGTALLEEVVYSDAGQPLTTTYLDYLLPASEDVPDIEMEHTVHPSAITPGGFKGVGESGTIPAPAAIANAVANAVPEIAENLVSLPMSPSRVWTLLDKAGLAR